MLRGHGDSAGVSSVLEAGDAQWMTAGRGIIHEELAEGTEQVHSLQLWVNLPAARKLTEPRFQDLRRRSLPSRVDGGARVTTYAGPGAATTVNSPMSLFHVELEPGARTSLEIDTSWRIIHYVLEGSIDVGGTVIPEGKVGLSHPTTASTLAVSAPTTAKVLIFSGLPFQEPIAHRGPFVMNTAAEFDQAMDDYRRGRLAPFPR